MSTAPASGSAPSKDNATSPVAEAKPAPVQTALEEDDEFEEFPVQDWDSADTEAGRLGKAEPAAGASGGKISDSLWEDNWDDDDIEEDFSAQLRSELAKAGKTAQAVEPMQH